MAVVRCPKCDIPLTSDEAASGSCPSCGSKVTVPVRRGYSHDEVHYARDRLQGPATGLLVLGIVNVLICLLNAIAGGFYASILIRAGDVAPGLEVVFLVYAGIWIVGLVMAAIVIRHSFTMRNMESYGWALAASIIAILSPGCLLFSLPIGIWAVVVLRDRRVRGAFR